MDLFTEKKIRLAILLSGQLRHWDITSKIFAMYNDIHPDVQYDFFLSTWDDDYMGTKAITADFSFLNAHEVISPSVLKKHEEDYVKYPYLLKRVNQLKNDYQHEHDIKYDCVISTRPDIFLSLDMLHGINVIINNTHSDQITPNTIYSHNAIGEKMTSTEGSNILIYHFTMADYFVFGHENVINIHANLYDDMYVKKIQPNLGVHITPATHIINNKLNCKSSPGWHDLVRYTHIDYLTNLDKTGELKNMFDIKHITKYPQELAANFKEFANEYDKIKYSSNNSI